MAEITLDRSLTLLSSEKQRERSDGLAGGLFLEYLAETSLTSARSEAYTPAK
jgi:hypothetical protein